MTSRRCSTSSTVGKLYRPWLTPNRARSSGVVPAQYAAGSTFSRPSPSSASGEMSRILLGSSSLTSTSLLTFGDLPLDNECAVALGQPQRGDIDVGVRPEQL